MIRSIRALVQQEQAGGQVMQVDHRVVAHHHAVLDRSPKFADISRPIVGSQQFERGGGGLHRGGAGGAIMAFLGFTLPSFGLMTLAGVWALTYGVTETGALGGVIAGLKLVAFAVVAQAIWGMGQALSCNPY